MTETTLTMKLDAEISRLVKATQAGHHQQRLTYADFFDDRMLMIRIIKEGVPFSLFALIEEMTAFSEEEWAGFLDISTKSLQRYRQTSKPFRSLESEKIIELAEVTNFGLHVFGDPERFRLWLHTPNYALNNFPPVALLKDSYGKELVLTQLTHINHGIFA